MAIARHRLVDTSVTRWYHCLTRCVRQAPLLADSPESPGRKLWLEKRIAELAGTFAVAVAGFAVLDNHLHLLVRLDPDRARGWSDEEVARRWAGIFPPRDGLRRPVEISREWLDSKLKDPAWIAKTRERLANLGWFMKCLKEPLARLANKADDKRGAFFEGRYKSIAVLDEESLLAVCAYIDLNPLAAGIAQVPESSPHTSLNARVDHVRRTKRLPDLLPGRSGNVPASFSASGLEDGLWLCPIEDRRRLGADREGMIEGFTLAGYLLLVDHAGRLFREGKATIGREAEEILTRLGCDAVAWHERLIHLTRDRPFGRVIAAARERLRSAAERLGVSRLADRHCPAG